jgi:hypothetical protein
MFHFIGIPSKRSLALWLACCALLLGGLKQAPGEEEAVVSGEVVAAPPEATTLAPPEATPLAALWSTASAGGKYRMLLRQIEVAADREAHGDFKDDGLHNRMEYAGYADLPRGHWVYAQPNWYIWRDVAEQPLQQRSWGTEQATGEPDTNAVGDIETAWASLSQDSQEEWLLLEYADLIEPLAVQVYETYNPGALTKVSVFNSLGMEEVVWEGEDPTPLGAEKGVSIVPFKTGYPVNRVKLYFDSVRVAGWNEIDAVGLRDNAGQTHWATVAHASSTYAEQQENVDSLPLVEVESSLEMEQRIAQLEMEVGELRQTVDELKQLQTTLEELKRLLEQKVNE